MEKSEKDLITITDVCKRYMLGSVEVHALRGVNLTLKSGEFTALVGASGSGKSTLLNIIGLIDEPTSGKVLLKNYDAFATNEEQRSLLRNRYLGYIFQTFNLIPVLTVYENVELPLLLNPTISPEKRRERVISAIQTVGLQLHTQYRPDKLSGGQRQRVAIARALVIKPMLILADEPTANLDSETTNNILDLMQELNRNRNTTFLFSTHDEKLMKRMNRIVYLKDGVIKE